METLIEQINPCVFDFVSDLEYISQFGESLYLQNGDEVHEDTFVERWLLPN